MKIVVGSSSMAKKIYFEEYFKDYDCEFVLGKDLGIEEPRENELLIKEDHGQNKYHLFVEKVVDEIAELLNLKRKQEGTMKEMRRFKQKMDNL